MISFFSKKACFIFLSILLLHGRVIAQDARLTNIIATQTDNRLLCYLTLEDAFTKTIEEAIFSGVPTTFSFFFTLHQPRKRWFKKRIKTLKADITIKYNSLKKEFVVTRSWGNNKPLVTKSFEEARNCMEKIEGVKIIRLSKLDKGKHYQIKAKAKLSKITLPFYLHNVFFFVSRWNFETDWYPIEFAYK